MAKYIKSCWVPDFWNTAPYFNPVRLFASELKPYSNWPTLSEYQQLLQGGGTALTNSQGQLLKIVAQGPHTTIFAEKYAPRIYLTGEIQTRTENWHDLFQVLTWRLFPRTKAVINQRQYHAALQQQSVTGNVQRSKVENMLSLFDECGAVLLYSDENLGTFVREFEWQQLFWEQRTALEEQFSCVIFGHALYEKMFNPYIGVTANSILIPCKKRYFDLPLQEQMQFIDRELSRCLRNHDLYQQPGNLAPFPLLGLPGWYPENEAASFYDNSSYFRPRNRPSTKRKSL